MIREMGNVELFELCETIPKVQCSECLLHSNQGIVHCTCGPLLKESDSSQNFHQGRLDALSIRTTSSRRKNPTVLGTAKPRHRKSISWPTMRGRDVSNENFLKEFTIEFNEIQHIVIRTSKIGWIEEKCIEMDKLAQENHSCCPSSEEFERYKKNWFCHTEQIRQKCTDETPIRLPRSTDRYAPSSLRTRRRMFRTNPFSTIPKVAPVFFQLFMVELG